MLTYHTHIQHTYVLSSCLDSMYSTGLVGPQVDLAVDARGDVALAGHVFEEGGFVDGRKDAIVMKLASGDGSSLWTK